MSGLRGWTPAGLTLVAALVLIVMSPGAPAAASTLQQPTQAATADEAARELALRYAPVLQMRRQDEPCGPGEPYRPVDVDALMDNTGVAFRGPWHPRDLVKVAPTADDLGQGYLDYHLDFPGDALSPGCTFETWARTVTEGLPPTTYAHVTTERGKLALQYWFFYIYNHFNNKHEGDWEMIQLLFDASTPEEALEVEPSSIGYTQHSSAEAADWGDDKLVVVDGTHPVVYVAAGSHANFFSSALWLARSSEAGLGCDDTNDPHVAVRPAVAFVPIETTEYLQMYPWLGFEGRWGEQHEGFYNGPTGPNLKERWDDPVTWANNSWRDNSSAVPIGNTLLPRATDAFCVTIETGSTVLSALVRNPVLVVLGLLLLIGIVLFAASRTRWSPSAAHPVQQPRAWGQILSASYRTYRRHPLLMLALGVVYVPVLLVAFGLEWLILSATGLLDRYVEGEPNTAIGFVVFVTAGTISLTAYFCVLAAVARSVADLDLRGEEPVREAYRGVLERLKPLVAVALFLVVGVAFLLALVVTVPLALVFVVYYGFAVQAVMVENRSAMDAVHRSRALVRGHWWRVALVGSLLIGVGAVVGPLVGVVLLLALNAPFWLANLVTAVVYAAAIPYVALGLTFLFFDLRAREEVPAEIHPVGG